MSDLIRREDVDKAIRSICDLCGEDKKYNGVMCGACNLDSFIREYEDLPSAEPERKWIPVTEALPKEKEMVLITNKKGHVRCGQYQRTFDDINYRWWWKHKTLEEVLAWMPLPEPYRGDR